MTATYQRPYRRNTRLSPLGDPWRAFARCAELSEAERERFFPAHGALPEEINATKAICRDECPVREACLAYAIEARENHGIWGGTSPDERARVRRRWQHVRRKAAS